MMSTLANIRLRKKALPAIASGSTPVMRKIASGEFSLDNILNRMFEEFGIGEAEQANIIKALRASKGHKVGGISPENASFIEGAYARTQNRLLNSRGAALRPSLGKGLKLLPMAITALGLPVATSAGLQYLREKIGK